MSGWVKPGSLVVCAAFVLAGCGEEVVPPPKDPVITVHATVETAPVADADDAADDPAIWVNPADPAQSAIIGTNKQRGLYVYGLDGIELSKREDGRMNNVDLRQNIPVGEGTIDIVASTNRTNQTISLYRFDGETRTLHPLTPSIISGFADPYGLCMYKSAKTGAVYVIANDSGGAITQWRVTPAGGDQVTVEEARRWSVPTQPEGCVADDEAGVLFLGEENVGIWKFNAEPDAGNEGALIDTTTGTGHLTSDVEGLSIFYGQDGQGYLVASSQGSHSYNVYDRQAPHAFRGAFIVGLQGAVDGSQETDGLDVTSVPLGSAFPDGLLVTQDGFNTDPVENQNFKLIPWGPIRDGLKLQ